MRVEGQISNLSRPRSGHLYLTLVDDAGGETASRAAGAQLSVVIWRSTAQRLRFEPENGLRVIASGRVAIYEPRGAYQLVADRLEPQGVGDLQVAFEQLKARLAGEGLFDEQRKRELPFLPRCIGLITSPSGAAVEDFLRVLQERWPDARVRLAPVLVQGPSAAPSIVQAIEELSDGRGADAEPVVDVIVLARGGGSLEDLWAFNEEVVARAIAASPVPTVSAIGHETDFTIADFVADRRAPTPTAAATLVVPDRVELLRQVDGLRARLASGLRGVADRRAVRLSQASLSRFLKDPQLIVEERLRILEQLREELENHLYMCFDRWDDSLALAASKLDGLSPFAVLRRGYCVVLDDERRPVRRVADVEVGSVVNLRFVDGRARACLDAIEALEGEGPEGAGA